LAEEDETTNQSIEQKQKLLDVADQQAKVNRELSASYASQILEMQKLVEAGKEQQENLDVLLALKDKHVKKMAEEAAAYKKVQAEIAAINKKMSEMEDIGKTAAKNLRDLSRAFGVPKNFEKSLTGSILKLGMMNKKTKEGQKALGKFKEEMSEGFSAGNIAMSIMGAAITAMQDAAMFLFKNLKDVAISFDEMRASINATVLGAGAYVDIAKQTSIQNMQLGVTAEQAGEATIAIAKNMDLASDTSQTFAKQLAGTVSKMSTLGADASQTTKVLSFFQRGLKQTSGETNKMALRVQKLATGLKIGLGEAFDQLNTALPTLAAHGEGMTEVFEDLAMQARATGVSMQTLLGVAGKFDTFQAGAQSAAALNSLLGGSLLNSTELLRMSENERLKTIISTIQAQGVAFKDMDRFKQKAIANAVGITDMAEANKLFGMSMAEYEGYAAQVDKAEASQRALDEATAKAIPVIKSLQLAVADFVAEYGYVIQDILEGTLDIAKSFLKWKESGGWIEPWGFAVIGIIGSIVTVMGVMLVMTFKITAAMGGLAATASGVATSLAAIAAAGGGAAAVGGTAAVAAGGTAAAAGGTALLPILAGIALVAGAAYGVSKLFEGNERTTATTQAQQRTASEDYVIDNATLNLTFSAEETVRISKVLTNVGLKANGMS
jgi:hypothetical protein